MCFNRNHSGFFGGHGKMQTDIPFRRERTKQSFQQPLLDQHSLGSSQPTWQAKALQ